MHPNNNNNNNNKNENIKTELHQQELQQQLAACEENVENLKLNANERDVKDGNLSPASTKKQQEDDLSFCSSEALSNKCSGHGVCFDPLNHHHHRRLDAKEEQKRLVNSFGIASISSRREQQLRPGSCFCEKGFGGRDCSIESQEILLPVDVKKTTITQREAENLITVIVPRSRLAFQEDDFDDDRFLRRRRRGGRDSDVEDQFVSKLKKEAPNLQILVTGASESPSSSSSKEVENVNKLVRESLVNEKNSGVTKQRRPLLLILGPDVDFEHFDLWRVNLPLMVDQMLTTDVDILGMMTVEHEIEKNRHPGAPKKKQPAGSKKNQVTGASSRQHANNIFDPFCYQLYYHQWRLRHRKAPFGYERHQNFVMFCDRVSNTFMMRKSLLELDFGRGKDRSPPSSFSSVSLMKKALNKTLLGTSSDNVWPICSFSSSSCRLFEASVGPSAWIDFFLRLKRFNNMLSKQIQARQQQQDGTLLIGACAECIVDIVDRQLFVEQLTPTFAERHQIEVYFDAFGRRSKIVCTRSGGIYGHASKGLYAPLCHRLMRQRDFLWISNMWVHGLDSSTKNENDDDGNNAASPASPPASSQYSVSLHHGNLFGALRFQEELLWETDGDFDLIAHEASHSELMSRFAKLIKLASSKQVGFETVMTYPEKPWYVAFKKEKTDFQINARSPLSKQTRGKPIAQVHNVSIPYQGRLTHVNGFANPWASVRSDPGHDYRDLYLAQQGWVLHFTKNSVACGVEGHNACLPDCRSPEKYLFDHEFCSDESLMQNVFDRNPILWFDKKSDVMFREPMPSQSRHVVVGVGVAASEKNDAVSAGDNSAANFVMNEEELYQVANGETQKWMKNKLWQYL